MFSRAGKASQLVCEAEQLTAALLQLRICNFREFEFDYRFDRCTNVIYVNAFCIGQLGNKAAPHGCGALALGYKVERAPTSTVEVNHLIRAREWSVQGLNQRSSTFLFINIPVPYP